MIAGDLYGMPGPVLLFLQGKFGTTVGNRGLDGIRLMTNHHNGLSRLQRLERIKYMNQKRLASERVQDLGFLGTHPRSLSGRENHGGDRF
jgi:hypothetical protein